MPFLTTALVAGGIAAAGSLGGAALASSAAGKAADTQAGAANHAADLQYQAEQQALQFQNKVWNQQQSNQAPWLQSGAGALSTLDQLMGLNAPNIPANYGQPQGTGGTTGAAPNPFPGQGGQTGAPAFPGGPVHGGPDNSTLKSNYVRAVNGTDLNLGGGPTSGAPNSGAPPLGAPVHGTAMPATGNRQQAPGTAAPGTTAPGIGTGQLQPFAPWTQQFQAPTADQARQTPGYQFQLDQGTKAVQNSAAARGDLLSGNTLADLTQFGQGLADTTYNQTYDRALGQYQQKYNIYENNQANQFNRLASLAGMGQTSVGQLNSAGSSAAGQFGNTVLGSANAIGQNMNNAAAATASGYVGGANAWSGALGNLGSLGSMIPYLNMINQGSNPTTGINLNSAPNSPLPPSALGIP
jgi:hypothetical protein